MRLMIPLAAAMAAILCSGCEFIPDYANSRSVGGGKVEFDYQQKQEKIKQARDKLEELVKKHKEQQELKLQQAPPAKPYDPAGSGSVSSGAG